MLKYNKDKDEWVDCEDEETCKKDGWFLVNPLMKDSNTAGNSTVINDDPEGSHAAYIARLNRRAPQKGQQHKDAAPVVEGRGGYISRLTRSAWND